MSDLELQQIVGGGSMFSATFLNAIFRGMNILLELGRALGSSIRRGFNNNSCSF